MTIKYTTRFIFQSDVKVNTIRLKKDNNIELHVAMLRIMNKGRTLQRDTREISK